jgi:hypothetical protein
MCSEDLSAGAKGEFRPTACRPPRAIDSLAASGLACPSYVDTSLAGGAFRRAQANAAASRKLESLTQEMNNVQKCAIFGRRSALHCHCSRWLGVLAFEHGSLLPWAADVNHLMGIAP